VFASCLDFLVKDDVSAVDVVLMQVFDVCIGSGTNLGSSSSKVAIVDSMRARCCSPCVSMCPYIQVSLRLRSCAGICDSHAIFILILVSDVHHTVCSWTRSLLPRRQVVMNMHVAQMMR
jgi:hypothetical protein